VNPLLHVSKLSVAFAGDAGLLPVLSNINLVVQKGEIVGIVGESGSGKSLLLTAIPGLLTDPWRITSGEVRFQGQDLLKLGDRQRNAIRGKDLALAFSNPRQHLNPVLSVGRQIANVVQAHEPVSKAHAVERVLGLLTSVGIPDPAARFQSYPHELSGGMCQRIIIALAVANSPSLLLVDEPTNGLDVTISIQILDLMRDAVQQLNSALLLVSRDLGVVASYCERVAVMNHGAIVEEGPVRHFFKAPQNPYSRKLIAAAFAAHAGEGAVPDPVPTPVHVRDELGAVVDVRNLVKRFPVKGGRVLHAVNDVSFTVGRGEALGLVGESGSGKTTVGRCLLRLIEPSEGTIRFKGQDVTTIPHSQFRTQRSRMQMVFQDPFDSVDPRQRVHDAIAEPLALTTPMKPIDRQQRVNELLRLVGLGNEVSAFYPHQLSAGALQRVGIARAIATDPDLVVFDEPTSALDVSVRAEILDLLRDLQARLGIAYLFISHDLTAVRGLCQRVAIMYLGKIVEVGEAEKLFRRPLHPYSRALLSSVLYPNPDQERSRFLLRGEIPSPIDLPTGCPLHTRCPRATAECAHIVPPLEEKAPGRWLACIHVSPEEARGGAEPPEATLAVVRP
jgi:oligopeptide/dipeptide ABC transporter ATP-binding protein